ncbi:hypothetical protein G7Y79_00011g030780 [Physcia stellaris]|nr:hypothetical protein G7Y79_00011g030780 [Physcia stellaris]
MVLAVTDIKLPQEPAHVRIKSGLERRFERPQINPCDKESKDSVAKHDKKGPWAKYVDGYRDTYCPRAAPTLILPSAPTYVEKYNYVQMNRSFLVTCSVISLIFLAAGTWMFVRASPVFAWYAIYVFITQVYIFISMFVSILGNRFDLAAHQRLLTKYPLSESDAPTVDIYLPVCLEPLEMLENTWKNVAKLQYIAGKKSVYVLDDGADIAVQSLAKQFGYTYICRPNRPELKKAGNLRYAFTQTSGDFFVVFDADFCPRSDFLLETIPYHLADGKRAIVQTPQFFRSTADRTWTEQGAGASQEYIYRVMQNCRDKWGGAICVGSNAVYRRAALESTGGTVPAESSEDIQTGFAVMTLGWKVKYIPLVLACGVCPDTPRAYFSQQMRWADGSVALVLRRDFWTSVLTTKQKLCFMIGFLYYTTTAMEPLFRIVPAPLILWARPEYFRYYYMFFAIPSLLLEVLAYKLWARGRYTLSVQYARLIQSYAYLHAIWDILAGKKLSWMPSGDGKAHRDHRYRNMRILAWAWEIIHACVLIPACVYRVVQGKTAWYNLLPLMIFVGYNLLCVHRFLLYRHARRQ